MAGSYNHLDNIQYNILYYIIIRRHGKKIEYDLL